MHTINIKKKFFSHIITRKILGELSPNCKNIQPDIGLAVRVFANGPGGLFSIPGRVIPKNQKMVLDASLLNTQHYKVRIKGKVEQSREGVAPSPYTLDVVAIEKGAFGIPSTMVANFTFIFVAKTILLRIHVFTFLWLIIK